MNRLRLERRFVVLGHRARTDAEFALDDLCGATGRLDVLLRCVNSSFVLSHGIRTDTECYLILLGPPEPPKTLRLVGSELKHLNPDERSTAALVRTALREVTFGPEVRVNAAPGLYVSTQSFTALINRLGKNSELFYLKENGTDIRALFPVELGEQRTTNAPQTFGLGSVLSQGSCFEDDELPSMTFVLGDDRDLTPGEEAIVQAHRARVVSLGPLSLHADHCITIVHNELDRWYCHNRILCKK